MPGPGQGALAFPARTPAVTHVQHRLAAERAQHPDAQRRLRDVVAGLAEVLLLGPGLAAPAAHRRGTPVTGHAGNRSASRRVLSLLAGPYGLCAILAG